MRLFLLPISTRRTLIYCERVQQAGSGTKPPIIDRITNKSSETWAAWEKVEKGWKRKVTDYGNQVFKRIPYEEWGLKSIPPANAQRLADASVGKLTFEVFYPEKYMGIGGQGVSRVLQQLATERQSLHMKRMWWSIAMMPITIPFQILPIIPNVPFYYACYRAWSHYRAWYGGKLLDHLCKNNLIKLSPSKQMDELYTAGLLYPARAIAKAAPIPSIEEIDTVVQTVQAQTDVNKEDVMVLRKWNGKVIAEAFHLPEMEVDIERAVEQVEKSIKAKEELIDEKKQLEQAAGSNTEV